MDDQRKAAHGTPPPGDRHHSPGGEPASLHALLTTVSVIASDLNLDITLQRIVDAAAELSGARYGALGVLDESAGTRKLREFVTHGITAEQRAAIGPKPTGHGLLGVLIDNPRPLRVDDLSRHPLSYGFPANHPPMKTFLGAPIRIGNRVFGNLYLTERAGGGPFTDRDTDLIVALAAAAGVVIENARLYKDSNRRRRWLEAAAEVGTALLGATPPDSPDTVIAEQAQRAGLASTAALLQTTDSGRLEVTASTATDAETPTPDLAAAAEVLRTGDPVVPDPDADAAPLLLVRVGTGSRTGGVLCLGWAAGRRMHVAEAPVGAVETFAIQVGLMLEVLRSQEDRARLAVFEDRDRIGRDLHDLVIQRLFAIGLMLDNTTRLAGAGRVAERVGGAVDQLDETIKDIRRTIFELANPLRTEDVRDEITRTIRDIEPSLGFRPELSVSGPIRSGIPDDVRPHLIAVLQEALSNVSRHAHADSVQVLLEVGDEIGLTVIDDGRGIPARPGTGHGVRNMRERAEKLGGTCEIQSGQPRGAIVDWRVPSRR